MNSVKKILSFVLCFVIAFSIFPATAFADEPLQNDTNSNVSKTYGVGDHIAIGTKNDTDISWEIIAVEDGKALLFCDNVIDIVALNITNNYVYGSSSLASWCESFYASDAFTEAERSAISSVMVEPENQHFFIFSKSEFLEYFPSGINGKRTLFEGVSGVQGAYGLDVVEVTNDNIAYWLRSTTHGDKWIDLVSYDQATGDYVEATSPNISLYECIYGICPAFYLDISAAAELGIFIDEPDESTVFTLGKNNNNFTNKNWTGGGFEGITNYVLSKENYAKLLSYSTRIEDQIMLTLRMLPCFSKWGGCCYGVSATMLLAYAGLLDLEQFENGVSNYFDMPRPCNNEDFLEVVEYFQLAQDIINSYGATGDDIPALLSNIIGALNLGPVVFNYKANGDMHSILALDYQVNPDGSYTLRMYDLNSTLQGETPNGVCTQLNISKDFKKFSLSDFWNIEGRDPVFTEETLDYLSFCFIDDIDRVNIFKSNNQQTSTAKTANPSSIDIVVPADAISYRIENAEGEVLICDDGHFSGDMDINALDGFFAGNDGSGCTVSINVNSSDYYKVTSNDDGVDVWIISDNGCLTLKSDDICSAVFYTDGQISFGGENLSSSQNFICTMSKDMVEDGDIQIVYASATTYGETLIQMDEGKLSINAEDASLNEAALWKGMEETILNDSSSTSTEVLIQFDGTSDEPTDMDNPCGAYGCEKTDSQDSESENKKIKLDYFLKIFEPTFDDVSGDAFYYDAVQWAAEKKIAMGNTNGLFLPNDSCTRAQAVTFLWRAAGSPEPKSDVMPFEDVAVGAYYYKAVLWALEDGITIGTSATTFSPDAECTRAQIVTFLWRSQKSPVITAVNCFVDVDVEAYYHDAVLWAVDEEITNGTSETTFSPDADCTRAQIVTFLYRCMGDK